MWDMKGDMGGSAAVVGAMAGLAGRKAKANVVGIVGLVENMPDGNVMPCFRAILSPLCLAKRLKFRIRMRKAAWFWQIACITPQQKLNLRQ